MAGIYVHIPFCKQACHYCDFHFSTNQDQQTKMVSSIVKEIELQKGYLNEPVKTIYFGGGTPSMLNENELNAILSVIHSTFDTSSCEEITLEANPDDLSMSQLAMLHQVGVNRLSIGMQSFDDNVLKFLNRAHSSKESVQVLADLTKSGFKNVSVDLIYGIPDRSHKLWLEDIKKLVDFAPQHISAYCLTIEPNTAFGNWAKKGKLNPVSEDFAAEQFEMLVSELIKAGYEHYEISNFCLPGFESKHNSSYWRQKPYLGLGPSAHSYNLESRQSNVSNNVKYMKSIEEGKIPFTIENLTETDKANDYLLTSLRTKWGVDLTLFDLDKKLDRKYIDHLVTTKKIRRAQNMLFLTQEGKLIADKITEDLFIIDDKDDY
ncbi:radical SAM family heme chaperone HemW [Fulvivirga lutea]|uniref:Heme chaperone HemW n=1 Tax=Fulvivirga lutea TaxID=2810512 RepID=A0A974WIE2_9BACT|nr:radical SAM family heme chaperone HemW [Fulvivirga lutea]QSE98333.1 radical SAM family heme chaperone HemW [Fulvivirga lutea]